MARPPNLSGVFEFLEQEKNLKVSEIQPGKTSPEKKVLLRYLRSIGLIGTTDGLREAAIEVEKLGYQKGVVQGKVNYAGGPTHQAKMEQVFRWFKARGNRPASASYIAVATTCAAFLGIDGPVGKGTSQKIISLFWNKHLAPPSSVTPEVPREPRTPKVRVKIEITAEVKAPRVQRSRQTREQRLAFYLSDAWRTLRYQVLKNSGGSCCLCGRGRKDGVILHVDHIKPRSLYPELELDVNNLQVLCEDCNLGKSNKDETDWR